MTVNANPHYRRMLRREIHSSRSTVTVIAALLAFLVSGWLITEVLLRLFGGPGLLVPAQSLAAIAADPRQLAPMWQLGSAAVLLLIGLLLLTAGLKPGCRHRHSNSSDRCAIVVDDRTLASGLAAAVAREAGVPADQVRVAVGKHQIQVDLQPISGLAPDKAAAQAAIDAELARLALEPRLKARIRVAKEGKL